MLRTFIVSVLVLGLSACSHVTPAGGFGGGEDIVLGGLEQAISVGGTDPDNPVLLFLHGGPGVPEMPVAWKNAELENHFTVVQWDQRGAGKSSGGEVDYMNLTSDQIVRDTLELTRKLRDRFGGRRIYLVGFSFGSLVGAQAVAREPEHFAAYVGVSQLVNIASSESRLYEESLVRAKDCGDGRTCRRLEAIGDYPYPTHKVESEINVIQTSLVEPMIENQYGMARYLRDTLVSPDYKIADIYGIARGYRRSLFALEEELYDIDLSQTVRRLEVPVYFFAPRYDTVLSQTLAETYFEELDAPAGKRFIWFEKVGHPLHLEQPEKFQGKMLEVRDETWPM